MRRSRWTAVLVFEWVAILVSSPCSSPKRPSRVGGSLLDHLIRPLQEGWGDGQAERLGRLEVDH